MSYADALNRRLYAGTPSRGADRPDEFIDNRPVEVGMGGMEDRIALLEEAIMKQQQAAQQPVDPIVEMLGGVAQEAYPTMAQEFAKWALPGSAPIQMAQALSPEEQGILGMPNMDPPDAQDMQNNDPIIETKKGWVKAKDYNAELGPGWAEGELIPNLDAMQMPDLEQQDIEQLLMNPRRYEDV